MIGSTVTHYRILRKVGGGGMGVVYEAEDLELDRHVALKFLPAELAQDEQALNRFRREARAASALNHPHICTIHEIGEHEGQPFLILELLAGETLGKRIERGPLPIHDVVRFGAHLADALDTAHSAGIVHRDIKPANLFITERGDLKVLDFGLAKREAAGSIDDATSVPTMRASDGPLTSPGTTMGTVHYMSPEQVRAENVDARTDIFSAGVVIYQMATGKLPFDGSSPGVIFAAILSAQPEPPSSINREVSEAFEGVIGRALAKERSDRYQSALELMADLAEMPISADSWITTVPPTTRAPAAPFQATAELDKPDSSISAPHARWLWVALAVVGALAVGSAWMNFRSDAEPDVQRALPAVRPEHRVVVLPFENLGNPDNQYFASGVANEIISRLGSIGGLKVISHSAARHYAGTGKTLREIGEELEATHAVTGSVLWVEGDGVSRVRISPELIRIADDSQLWGDTIDQEVEDIFQVQGMIAEQIAANLGIELSETQRETLGAELTSNSQAYQAFLRGQAERVGLAEGNYVRAIALFETAVKLDPEFAEAWAELSRNKGHAHRMGFITDPTLPEQVRSDADRAVSLKPESTVAQAALGWYYYEIEGDYQRAAEIWEQIARRHPNDVGAARDLGAAYRRLGRIEDSGQEFARALRLEPNQPDILLNYGFTLAGVRQWDEATELFNKGVEIAPEIVQFYESLAHLTIASGGPLEDAKQFLAQAPGDTRSELMTVHWYERDYPSVLADLQQLPVDPWVLTRLGILHRRMGKPDEARAYFEQAKAMLEAMMPGSVINVDQAANATLLAWAQAGLGNVEEVVRIADTILTFRSNDLFSRPRYVIDGAAKAYAWAGETDRALDAIEEALSTPVQLGSGWRVGVSGPGFRLNPDWDELRGNPRFEALVDRLEAAN